MDGDNEESTWIQKDDELPPPVDTIKSKFTSCRWCVAYLSAMASILLITLRHCMSMAVVCMEMNITSSNISFETLNGTSYNLNNSVYEKFNPYISPELEGLLFSSYYYGYLTTPFMMGFLAARFGPKRVIGLALISSSVLTLLLPIAFRTNFYLVISIRVALGFASGAVLPAQQVLWSHWAPVHEKAQLAAFTNSGVNVGSIIVTVVSALLCSIPLDEGWPFIFYVYGGAGFVWLLIWTLVVYDSPGGHPRIHEREKRLIYYKKVTKTTSVKPPWKKVLRSPPFWALVGLHFSEAWVLTTITTFIPLYMDDVLKFSIKQNGSLSSLPFVGRFIGGILSAYIADKLIQKGCLSTTFIRKLFQTIVGIPEFVEKKFYDASMGRGRSLSKDIVGHLRSVLSASFLIGVSFLKSDQRILAVALLTLTMTSHSTTMASFRANYFDIAPRYSGQIMGVTLSIAIIGTIISPLITSAMTLDRTQEQWQKVFFITAGIVLASDVFFLVFGSGQEQKWALEPANNLEFIVPEHTAPDTDKSQIT